MVIYEYISSTTFLILLLGFTTVICSFPEHRNENQKVDVGIKKPTDINSPPIYEKDPICIDGTTRRCSNNFKKQLDIKSPLISEDELIDTEEEEGETDKPFEVSKFVEDLYKYLAGKGPRPEFR